MEEANYFEKYLLKSILEFGYLFTISRFTHFSELIAAKHSFPYVKKRIEVVDRTIEERSPIEVALDEMKQKVNELEDVVFTRPTDAKKLQLRLQGSICVQVNAGPLAYANAFLDRNGNSNYTDTKVEELKDMFQ